MATIGQAVLNIQKRAEQMVRGTVIGCASRIIKRTPVGNPDLWAGRAPVGYVGGSCAATGNHLSASLFLALSRAQTHQALRSLLTLPEKGSGLTSALCST